MGGRAAGAVLALIVSLQSSCRWAIVPTPQHLAQTAARVFARCQAEARFGEKLQSIKVQ